MLLTSSCCSNKTHQVKHTQVYWQRQRKRRGQARWRARNRRRTRVGEGGLKLVLGVGLGLGEILVINWSNDSSALVLADSRMQIVDIDITMRMGCMIFQPFCVRRISIYRTTLIWIYAVRKKTILKEIMDYLQHVWAWHHIMSLSLWIDSFYSIWLSSNQQTIQLKCMENLQREWQIIQLKCMDNLQREWRILNQWML